VKLDSDGLGSLKFESCQLSFIAFSLLFTCSDTLSNRESSPREDAIDLVRDTSNEPSEFDLRNAGAERS
jgi:hypothetical protein